MGHNTLSTYGIGKDLPRAEWAAIARELLRLGLVQQTAGEYPQWEITEHGLEALKSRRMISLTKPLASPKKRVRSRSGEISCDELLFSRLRSVRKKLADEHQVPAYIIFGDATLREMARKYPTTEREMSLIPGVGEKKLAEYGEIFCDAITEHLSVYPKLAQPA